MRVEDFDHLSNSAMINNKALARWKVKKDRKARDHFDKIRASSHSKKYENLRNKDPHEHLRRYSRILAKIPLVNGLAVGFSAVYNERQMLNMVREYIADIDTLQEPFASYFGKGHIGQLEYVLHYSEVMYNHYEGFAKKYPGGRIHFLCEYFDKTGVWLDLFQPNGYGLMAVANVDPYKLPKWIKNLDLYEFYQRCIRSGYVTREAREKETYKNGYSFKSVVMVILDRFVFTSEGS